MSKPGPQGWEFHKDQVVYLVVEEKGEGEESEYVLREFKFKKSFRWQRPGMRYLVCEPPLGGYREARNSRHLYNGKPEMYRKAVHPEACTKLLQLIGETPEEAVDMFLRVKLMEMLEMTKKKLAFLKGITKFLKKYPKELKKCQSARTAAQMLTN